jgi:hypothetical protein
MTIHLELWYHSRKERSVKMADKKNWGGARKGAGRPAKKGRRAVVHIPESVYQCLLEMMPAGTSVEDMLLSTANEYAQSRSNFELSKIHLENA